MVKVKKYIHFLKWSCHKNIILFFLYDFLRVNIFTSFYLFFESFIQYISSYSPPPTCSQSFFSHCPKRSSSCSFSLLNKMSHTYPRKRKKGRKDGRERSQGRKEEANKQTTTTTKPHNTQQVWLVQPATPKQEACAREW